MPNLVPREHLTNAISLNTLLLQITTIVGAALAGALVSSFSVGLVYAVSAVSLSTMIVSLGLMRYRGQVTASSAGLGWSAMMEGLRFTYHMRIIWGTMLLDFFATFFFFRPHDAAHRRQRHFARRRQRLWLAGCCAADTVSTVIRSTLRQLLTPDHLRGRMTSVNMVFFMGGPQLGELEAGLVAALLGAPFSIVSGGIATVLLTA